jgi:hypothetical protein
LQQPGVGEAATSGASKRRPSMGSSPS